MKKKKKKRARQAAIAQKAFVRGFVATGLLAAAGRGEKPMSKETARSAVKAGIAVAGGTMVAEGIQRKDLPFSMLSLAASAACMKAVDRISETPQNNERIIEDGQEEIA